MKFMVTDAKRKRNLIKIYFAGRALVTPSLNVLVVHLLISFRARELFLFPQTKKYVTAGGGVPFKLINCASSWKLGLEVLIGLHEKLN